MKRNILCFVILILLATPLLLSANAADSVFTKGSTGSEVYALQRRLYELGYLNYRPTGKYSDMTIDAVRKFQQLNDMTADGQVGASTRQAIFSTDAKRNESNPDFERVVGLAHTGTNYDKGTLSSWESINRLFPVGELAHVTDYNTEIEFDVKRVGGTNCAHVVTAFESDFDNYTEIFGGGESWEHRAVLVKIGESTYAASIFGMPTHSEPLNDSGMVGYTVLYFNNSKTDIFALQDAEHEIALTRIS